MVNSGQFRLKDANNTSLFPNSRFDLAYNAVHCLALAALRWHGYRASNRYIVFQALPYTTSLGPEVWRVLDKAHIVRNASEYEGNVEIDNLLLIALLEAASKVLDRLEILVKQLPA